MAPFKPFLSQRCKFLWSPELESAFQKLLNPSVKVSKSLTCSDAPASAPTGLGVVSGTSCSNCNCPSGIPDCCPGGWRITLAGSGFLSSAEGRYAAIEGEALAVAWGLEQTRYFTQGCDNLVVVTDHKPLVKIFDDRTLDEISNSRLFRLKQRTLPWCFQVVHLPGTSNHAADATSRHPSPSGSENSLDLSSDTEIAESVLMASIRHDAQELGIISWSLLVQETATDASLTHLLKLVEQGVTNFDRTDHALSNPWPICESVYSHKGVLLYQDRVVVPSPLRPQLLKHLHVAHQGTSAMEHCAHAIVFWPGMSKDICETREGCADCNRNAPSEAATPHPIFLTTINTI